MKLGVCVPMQKTIQTKTSFSGGKMSRIGLLAKGGKEVDGLGWFPAQCAQAGLDTLIILQLVSLGLFYIPLHTLLNPFCLLTPPYLPIFTMPPLPQPFLISSSSVRSEKGIATLGRANHTPTPPRTALVRILGGASKTHFFFCRCSGIWLGFGSCYCFPGSLHR